jgi:hypothetical protein
MALDRMAPVPHMARRATKRSLETFAQPTSGANLWQAVDQLRKGADAAKYQVILGRFNFAWVL